MNEGAVTLSHDGAILYSNNRFADMAETPNEKVIGQPIYQFITSIEIFESAFQAAKTGKQKLEAKLKRKGRDPLPVYVSLNPLLEDEVPCICAVITDLEALKESEKKVKDLASRLVSAQEEERRRIALDIHDILAATISAAKLKVEAGMKGGSEGKLEGRSVTASRCH